MDKGNVDEVNYVDFCEDVDGSKELFGVGRDFNHSFSYFPKTQPFVSNAEIVRNNPDDLDDTIARMSDLVRHGVRFSIDDFGTGYSNLSYLQRFAVDKLKIDRSFVMDTPQSADDVAIVTAIIQMGQALRLHVIAEGVETEAQRDFLARAGCDEFQGFLYAPALDPLAFEERVWRGGGKPPASRSARHFLGGLLT